MKKLFLICVLTAAFGRVSFASEMRVIQLSVLDDSVTGDRWPQLTYEGFLEFCKPVTATHRDMISKASFANTANTMSDLIEVLFKSDLKNKMTSVTTSPWSITFEIPAEDVSEMRNLTFSYAKLYDLTDSSSHIQPQPIIGN
jgi:hypothetical protein